ncbi:high affinity immunoglobulin epsilon receptor subunit beta isoform X2 [Diceros bicornis minor]|uniref:high affinity immunoglobulin epsilon receptor subunit beta isoform X2 n=1 Tax=Diceros bicornis minor TaxID=77932 RepID=UPI0026EF6F84|nr:high affinity immunoglobulin epsilon receptor subunit beta isoform X2 [Diceros bicornis minor]
MDTENRPRAAIALPNPQEPSRVSEIEVSEVSLRGASLLGKAAPTPPGLTWLTFLRKELEFLGVTQILIGFLCFCFGTIVCFVLNISEFDEDLFSSFKVGYPFWGAVFFVISGFLSVMSEEKHGIYLVRGSLGANTVSSIAAGAGIIILIINLKKSSAYIYNCQETYEDVLCLVASFSTEIVAMILFLTILGFCSAVSLTVYGVREVIEGNKIPEDRLYEELNIYSPIYSELEDRGEISSPSDS